MWIAINTPPDCEADGVQLEQGAATVSNDDQGDPASEERQRGDDEERREQA